MALVGVRLATRLSLPLMFLTMIRTVSLSVLSVHLVRADDASGPCRSDEPHSIQNPSTPTFCQPEEEEGSYGVRYWTMPADVLCEYANSRRCITLDDMHCNGGPDLCLKDGLYAYCGRLLIPQGVKIYGYNSWSCDDNSFWFQTQGPTSQPEVHWDNDVNRRVPSFTLALEEGYTCSASARPPVQRSQPCKPQNITGQWKYWFSQQGGDSFDQIFKVGMETTETTNDQHSFTVGLKEEISGGFQAKVAKGSVTFSSEQSWSTLHSVSDALTHSIDQTQQKTLTGTGTYWQFVVDTTNTQSCNEAEHSIFLADYVHTPNIGNPPCCAPGTFKNIEEPNGECLDGYPRLCEGEVAV